MTLRWHKIFPDGGHDASVNRGGRISHNLQQSGGEEGGRGRGVMERAPCLFLQKIMSTVYDENVNSSEIIAFEAGEGNSHF